MLRAILWAKAHMSYLESGRPDPREGSLQSQRRKVYEIGRNRLAAHRRWRGERYRQNSLSDLGRPDQGLPFQHSDPSRVSCSFVSTCGASKSTSTIPRQHEE
jgi:hypothetical protein